MCSLKMLSCLSQLDVEEKMGIGVMAHKSPAAVTGFR